MTGTETVSGAPSQPMRRDAVRNLERVLASAGELLDQHGDALTMDMIARHAGVGVATVYRRFENKDALLRELTRLIFEEAMSAGRVELARADGSGLRGFLQTLGRIMVAHRGHVDQLVGRGSATERALLLEALIGELLADAQQHAQAGPDVVVGDIMTTIWGLRGVIDATANIAPKAWVRHLDLHLAALRGRMLPLGISPGLSIRQLRRIARENRL